MHFHFHVNTQDQKLSASRDLVLFGSGLQSKAVPNEISGVHKILGVQVCIFFKCALQLCKKVNTTMLDPENIN